MNAKTIEGWIRSLGRRYDVLIAEGLIPNQPLQELYEGRDRLYLEPALGLSLSFWAETKRLETLFITLLKSTPSTVEYKGELPRPLASTMTKSDIRSHFGVPIESGAPVKMPQPGGMTGGWDAYHLDPSTHPNIKLVCKYSSTFQVKALVFTLIDKSHV
ncbi:MULTISPECIES: DUF6392 family protein [Pseudomonas]|uniref:Pyocin immunity protein n=1 Tax=Pseudomonas libanensis TaxID=75588 RepID=A0ABR5MDS0_9PSED|nr:MULTISPECIES: DUF6392 family protein [Pseudomonas]KPG77385.1 hypothetical protein AEQ48_03340 [Pseudomonas libanensis]KRA07642.1 hypothetical protein ASD70_11910 [Pseudomonas sp. Root569]NHC50378.1 hypothetical protein [Pseudomonas sp. AU8050]WDG42451.1 DUF6392 family protein [Pseudomonas synxantha]SFY23275.1 hypothetical protein SAMN03159316_4202 [Pseudomonas sp. NFR02]